MAEGEGFEPRYSFPYSGFQEHCHFRVAEHGAVRAEFFNILNHPNFADPLLPSFVADPESNLSNSCSCGFHAAGNREVGNGGYGIVATGDVRVGNPFLGGGGPRGIQLAAKFTF